MKKIIIIILICFFLTGCMKYNELNELAVVKVLELDYQKKEYLLHANIILDNEDHYEEINASGKTLEEVFQNAYQSSKKKLYLTHTELLVLTEDSISQKLEEITTFFLKNSEARTDFNLALTSKKDIDIAELNDFIRIVEEETGATKEITFEEMLKNLYSNNLSYIPIIEDTDKVSGIYFIKDNHLIEKLTKEETIIYNLLENNITKAQIEDFSILSSTTITRETNKDIVFQVKSTIHGDPTKYRAITKYKIQEFIKKYQSIGLFPVQGKQLTIQVEGEDINEETGK